jgi:hypothetical protein
MRSRVLLALTLAATVAAVAAPVADAASSGGRFGAGARYVVRLTDSADRPASFAKGLTRSYGARIDFVYRHAFNGFAGRLPAAAIARLQADPRVVSIEPDIRMSVDATQNPAPSWGLDRIDQRALPLAGGYTYTADGTGVTAYIIDTGIRLTHTDFTGRIRAGYDAVTTGGDANDCYGHGTHVAGTVGGTTYGVAKKVTLVPVRVLDCGGSGTISGVIAGIDWTIADHQANVPAVANMSLGGGYSPSLDTAVANGVADGITFAVAAGNSNANACYYSPARAASAITVAAAGSHDSKLSTQPNPPRTPDQKASYSNYGSCVDIWAPGTGVVSDWYSSDTATRSLSGTSMATPHVAGVAALILSAGYVAPATVASTMISLATPNVITGMSSSVARSTPNRLLYTDR